MRNMYRHALACILCNVDMEQTGTVAGNPLEATAETAKPRKPAVSKKAFIKALKAASAREKKPTAAELAIELGMEKGSFDQRLNQLRMDWKDYKFVVDHKNGATPESLKMTQADFDKVLNRVKENGVYDAIAKDDTEVIKPFPWTLADGRSAGGNAGRGAASTRNAILAALMDVDGDESAE